MTIQSQALKHMNSTTTLRISAPEIEIEREDIQIFREVNGVAIGAT